MYRYQVTQVMLLSTWVLEYLHGRYMRELISEGMYYALVL